ncbi:MAG TPA: hypothetical protein VJ986_06210 [Gaiellaceae bacterium]|nr:hypothetical protein [Gaiellaceae bacterium]
MDVSFLAPLDALFGLAAAVPLAALLLTERRSARIRAALSLAGPRRRTFVPVVVSLVLLPALVGVAAAQPVVVRRQLLPERADAQAFFVFDTSKSMSARAAPGAPTRLARAKRDALRLRRALTDVPVGIASMTDRTLPALMPTTDAALFGRTLAQSIGIDRPPPSQPYTGRATTFEALLPLVASHFYSHGVTRRLLVVFTDGESSRLSSTVPYTIQVDQLSSPIFVHVWSRQERIFVHGRPDRGYVSDPSSGRSLARFARLAHGRVFEESQIGQAAAALHAAAGRGATTTAVSAYARIALAPWFVLGGVLPLAFLFWRRNL